MIEKSQKVRLMKWVGSLLDYAKAELCVEFNRGLQSVNA